MSPHARGRVVPDRHARFVHDENIARFLDRLSLETDPVKRAMLARLLAEERAQKLPHPSGPTAES